MGELRHLTDATLDDSLNGAQPVLLLFTTGEGLRSDFKVAFEKAAKDNNRFLFARIDPAQNPNAASRFGVGEKPVLVVWANGQELTRRVRPWGTDLPLALELLAKAQPAPVNNAQNALTEKREGNRGKPMENKDLQVIEAPVTVTDATFEQEVLNSDLPVLVDFWAEWCGPCRMVAPSLEKLAKEFAGQVKIAKVNVDENQALSNAFRVQSIPLLMIIKNRTMIFNQPGALPEAALRDLIQQAIAIEIPPQTAPNQPEAQ